MSGSLREQLLWLKANTVRTGAIHEAQVLQLKLYPRMLPNVISAEARVDTERKLVHFVAESSGLRPTKKFKQICELIDKWTKALLWDESNVVIEVNGKTVFDSRNQ